MKKNTHRPWSNEVEESIVILFTEAAAIRKDDKVLLLKIDYDVFL